MMAQDRDLKAVVEMFTPEGEYIGRNVFQGALCTANAATFVEHAEEVVTDGYIFEAMLMDMGMSNLTTFVPTELAEARLAKLRGEGVSFTPSITRFYAIRIDPALVEKLGDPKTDSLLLLLVGFDDDGGPVGDLGDEGIDEPISGSAEPDSAVDA